LKNQRMSTSGSAVQIISFFTVLPGLEIRSVNLPDSGL
jgi:hypothetical protein